MDLLSVGAKLKACVRLKPIEVANLSSPPWVRNWATLSLLLDIRGGGPRGVFCEQSGVLAP